MPAHTANPFRSAWKRSTPQRQDITVFDNRQSEFRYRERCSNPQRMAHPFVRLRFTPGDPVELTKTAHEIRDMRDKKYPPTMKCAGSIFKNLFFANLPASAQAQIPPKWFARAKCHQPGSWNRPALWDCGAAIYKWPIITRISFTMTAQVQPLTGSVIKELKARVRQVWY